MSGPYLGALYPSHAPDKHVSTAMRLLTFMLQLFNHLSRLAHKVIRQFDAQRTRRS